MRPQHTDEEDAEYQLAIEASKYQEEEDRRKRESRNGLEDDDDDLAKAIKLSKEEEERRRRELEESNATSLFDDEPAQQPQPTGYNQGYQQGSAVDFFANPIDQQPQPTGYNAAAYTGYQTQPTGYQNGYSNGFGGQPTSFGAQPTGYDMFNQQQMQQPMQQPSFQPQPTGYNPYAQQQIQSPIQQIQSPIQQEPTAQPGSNNPWATNGGQNSSLGAMRPMPTGSNNPFAQQQPRPQAFKAPTMPTLGSLPEQKTLSTFNQQPSFNQSSFGQSSSPFAQQPTATQQQPRKEVSEHEARLNALLASGEGMDTFGNTGELRIPAQHTAPGTFVNSAGSGLNRLHAEQTGNNPFLRQQFTGMPQVSYQQQMPAATGPAGMGMGGGFGGGQGASNPFAGRPQQQQNNQGGDLIQF
jgi:epsin